MAQLPELEPLSSATLPTSSFESEPVNGSCSSNIGGRLQKRDVLIVDDVPNNLRVLSTALKEHGYQVRTVLSAKMAFSAVRMALPDLILLDINLPDMDGYSVCRELKLCPETAEVPILFLSALGEAKSKVAAFHNGGVDYITKPFQLEEVVARVGLQFKLKELAEDLRQKNLQLNQLAQHLRRQNDALSEARKVADCASQAKSEFLSCMSHELRTPLTAILGFNQLLMGEPEATPHQRETMGVIDRSGKHLLNLINEVLDLSKIEANRAELSCDVFDLKDALHDLHQMFLLEAEAKGLDFSLNYEADTPRFIRGDESKIRQIIINLLGNALKFTTVGFIRLSLHVRERRGDTAALRIVVEDSGPGITEADAALLFEPFRQTDAGQQSRQGTGLGLCLSRQFAQLMGGDVHLESQVAQGSRFIVELECEIAGADALPDKAVQTHVRQSAPEVLNDPQCHHVPAVEGMEVEALSRVRVSPASRLQPSSKLASLCTNRKMLVVDDHPENRSLLVQLLESAGCQVREAETGAEAIACYSQWQPQLIWMDMKLPDMEGQAVIHHLKKCIGTQTNDAYPTYIVAITASVYDQEQLLAAEQSCDGLIQKPFSVSQIWDKIAELFGAEPAFEVASVSHRETTGALPLTISPSSWSEHQQSCFIAQLERMPRPWLERLYYSSLALDEFESQELLQLIPEDCEPLKQQLGALFQNLRYDRILTTLEKMDVGQEALPHDSFTEYLSVG